MGGQPVTFRDRTMTRGSRTHQSKGGSQYVWNIARSIRISRCPDGRNVRGWSLCCPGDRYSRCAGSSLAGDCGFPDADRRHSTIGYVPPLTYIERVRAGSTKGSSPRVQARRHEWFNHWPVQVDLSHMVYRRISGNRPKWKAKGIGYSSGSSPLSIPVGVPSRRQWL